MPEKEGNLLILQSGTPTAVSNSALAGAINEALNHGCIEEIYGVVNGFRGLLHEKFIDLAEQSQQSIRALQWTPSAALGTGGDFLLEKEEDLKVACDVLVAHNIQYLICIGDETTLASAEKLHAAMVAKGCEVSILGVPLSSRNRFSSTDFTLGYGSALKTLATYVRELEEDALRTSDHDRVNLIEIQGDANTWLVAGAALARSKQQKESSYSIIYTAEMAFSAESFLNAIRDGLKNNSACTVVFPFNLVDENGDYLVPEGGNGKMPAEYMAELLTESLGVDTTIAKLDAELKTRSTTISEQDSKYAHMAGQEAVRLGVKKDVSGEAITFFRNEKDLFNCEVKSMPIADFVGAKEKVFPADWVDLESLSLKYPFVKYAFPLIQCEIQVQFDQGLPKFAQFQGLYVDKKL